MARVLVVDADHDIRESLTDLLSLDGYTVLEASSPEQAWAILRTCPECIVVLFDSSSPSTGEEDIACIATAAGQERDPIRQHAFICLTTKPAHLHERLYERLRDALGTDVIPIIQKPFDLDALLRAVADAAATVDARNPVRARKP